MLSKGKFAILIISIAVLISPAPGLASTVFYGFDDDGRDATAEFVFTGSDLFVTLTNAAKGPAFDREDILTALFFDLVPPDSELDRVEALLAPATAPYPASLVTMNGAPIDPQPAGGNVSGEWAYVADLDDYGQAIGSAGFGLFGPQDNFPGGNLDGPVCVAGAGFGIIGPAGIAFKSNGDPAPPLKNLPLIQNAVVFQLTGLPAGTVFEVDNVVFQYGTDLDEPHFIGSQAGDQPPPVVPEPITMAGVLLAVGGLGGYIRKRLI